MKQKIQYYEKELKEWKKFVGEIIEECNGYFEDCFFSQWPVGKPWQFSWARGNSTFLNDEEYRLLKELLDKQNIDYKVIV